MMADNGKYKTFDQLLAAGSGVTVGAMQNVFIEDWIHAALPKAKVDQFDSPDSTLQALNAGRIDAYQADQSAMRWLMAQTPGRYLDAGYGWMPNSYASAVKPGDQVWLQLGQHGLQGRDDGGRFRHLQSLLQEMVRHRPGDAEGGLPGRVRLS